MDKERINQIIVIANEQLENLDEENKGAMFYLQEIIEAAATILNDGY